MGCIIFKNPFIKEISPKSKFIFAFINDKDYHYHYTSTDKTSRSVQHGSI